MRAISTLKATTGALRVPSLSAFIHNKRGRQLRHVEPSTMEDVTFKEMFDGKDMDEEDCRLQTFFNDNWPTECPVSVKELATDGFCYTGTKDEVVCFSCKGKISGWKQYEVPLMMHYKVYPDCKLVKKFKPAVEKIRKSGTQFDSKKAGPAEVPLPFSDENDASSDTYTTSELIFFASEFNRLMTFCQWPLMNPADRYDLAASGFIRPDEENELTVCVACGLEVTDWELGDLPQKKHAKLSPKCPFVEKKDESNKEMDSSEKYQYVKRGVASRK